MNNNQAHYSECCGVLTFMYEYGICPFCKEHCEFVTINDEPIVENIEHDENE